MALGARPELVGKRFVCSVLGGGEEPPELGEIGQIGRWGWRAGVIRAVSHRDNDNPELTVSSTDTAASGPSAAPHSCLIVSSAGQGQRNALYQFESLLGRLIVQLVVNVTLQLPAEGSQGVAGRISLPYSSTESGTETPTVGNVASG
ncbi:hypothetical protein XELAEV_18036813mg [Xenopus laevis]|uniref:DUF7030 domain-containing protein n=1 Tax=Xenopus laevis TaxID=8355 RepID=A0A974H9L6_XENLA|nr:hypothetical protein XELAEV_18036813mg [Xenopus laevis]